MIDRKSAIFLLIATFAQTTNAEEPCFKDIGIEDYKLESCKIYSEQTISEYSTKNPLIDDDRFSHMPISISISKIKPADHKKLPFENNISPTIASRLPHEDQIVERNTLNDSAARKLPIPGWQVIGETIVYRSKDPDAGMTIICAQASKKMYRNYITVSQCSPFYRADIDSFQKTLQYVEGATSRPRK
ncbi:hypothetical protein [Burkholderia sp. IMCC1007]|uniref:hypothetical protein n=1 Tax=Burkholderia sp. IMCC1007 TaxID=3004104 RepID=UPI0022B57256|nr:hypothetical protein [Burkholderia sp. IMCC1007]